MIEPFNLNAKFVPGGMYELTPKNLWLKMDQTNIMFEPKFGWTVSKKGVRSVASKDSGSNQRKCTICITVAADGTAFPPFFIFKGVPGKSIEEELREWNVKGCAQINGWLDDGVGAKWVDHILKPYLEGKGTVALLMLDHHTCHIQATFKARLSRLWVTPIIFLQGILVYCNL
jgi:DDE superfamily endonuclease